MSVNDHKRDLKVFIVSHVKVYLLPPALELMVNT